VTDEPRSCLICGADLVGPLQPEIALKATLPAGPAPLAAQAWLCPACGLVSWYARAEGLGQLLDALPGEKTIEAQPGLSYERRTQMLKLLRRLRRM
jgi:hypothetical protein